MPEGVPGMLRLAPAGPGLDGCKGARDLPWMEKNSITTDKNKNFFIKFVLGLVFNTINQWKKI